ncbi:hypothetical protein B0H19DRAFT_1055290 [Mycena capillaripes]|nr:hypothetical protein B0H19DRAFT_1055290 [Mycena capillaripes]
MLRPCVVFLGAIPATLLGFMYYEHRRLQAVYPTLRVPPALEIFARNDRPAFGMSGLNDPHTGNPSGGIKNESDKGGEPWMRTHAGDMWAVTVPRRLVTPSISLSSESEHDGPLIIFARTFWDSWPLRVERHIVVPLANLGIIFGVRAGSVGHQSEGGFVEGSTVMGGGFIVEAHDPTATTSTETLHGPLVISWWLRPVEDSGRIGLLGGYHSFAVEDTDPVASEDSVRLCFVSHLVLSQSDSADGEPRSIPSRDLRGFSLKQRVLMHFHELYSRILLDLAVKGLERRARA